MSFSTASSLFLPPPRCCWPPSSSPAAAPAPLNFQLCVQFVPPASEDYPKEGNGQEQPQARAIRVKAEMNAVVAKEMVPPMKELAFLSPENEKGATIDDGFMVDLKGEHGERMGEERAKRGQQQRRRQCFADDEGEEEEEEEGEGHLNGQNQLDQTDIYRELILRHLIADISGTCAKLGLPSELAAWTGDDCCRWVAEMCAQFQLNVPPVVAFRNLNGRKMLALAVDEFQTRFPDGGDTLHAQLQLWKTAFESCGQFVGGFPSPQQQQQNAAGWLSPSPNEFGAPSSCSSASQYSSSGRHNPAQHQFTATSTNQQQQQKYYAQHGLFPPHHPNHYAAASLQFGPHSDNAKMQCPPPPLPPPLPPSRLGPPSDCSATESVSSAQQDDSSSVAEDDFVGADLSQNFFLSAHQQPPMLFAANFCPQFPSQIVAQQHNNNGAGGQHHPQQHRLPGHGTGGTIHLWHFIRELLDQPKEYGGCVRWVDRKEGTFKIESSHHLARYWGMRKNRSAMNYDKLSRSLRQYYKKGIIQKPEKKQRLVYKFLPPYNQ